MTQETIISNYENKIKKIDLKILKLKNKEKLNKFEEIKFEDLQNEKICLVHLKEVACDDFENLKIERAITKEKKKRYNILYGNLFSTILMICIPLMVYQFFNSFYNLLDQIMAANIAQTAVSKIGVISQLKNAVSAFGAGIAGGGSVLVARYYGAGNMDEARHSASNMLFISCVVSAIILLVLIPLAYPILKIAQTPDIDSNTITYFIMCLIELVAVSINNIFIGLEKIKGNSKKILYLNVLMLLVKLLLNSIFVYVIKVDNIAYLELSTIIGQSILLSIGIIIMFSKKNLLKLSLKQMLPKKDYILPIIKLSIPIFLGKFVMNIGKSIVNALCGSFYGEATGGLITGALAVSNNLSGLVTSPVSVYEEGQSSIISQNIGNKNIRRTMDVFRTTCFIVLFFVVVGFVLVRFVFLDELTNLFSITNNETNSEISMTDLIKQIFMFDCLSIPALGLASAVLGVLYGYGKTFLSGILNGSRILIRIISLIVLHACGINYKAAGISMGISNILIGLLSLIAFIIFYVGLRKNGYQGMYLTDKRIEKEKFEL